MEAIITGSSSHSVAMFILPPAMFKKLLFDAYRGDSIN
jgi:hypothetical protein